MACNCECVTDSGEIGGSGTRKGQGWDAIRLRCVVASPVELALQIRLGDLKVTESHADIFMTHQLLERGQANSATKHVRGPGMAQAVRRDPASIGTICAFGKIGHCNSQHLEKGKPATNARQEKALGFRQTPGGELGSQLQDAVYQSKAFGIEGHQAFTVHFSERYM